MLPILHPLAKTAIQLRQSLHRLEHFKQTNPDDADIKAVDKLIEDLKSARNHIPKHLRDIDLKE